MEDQKKISREDFDNAIPQVCADWTMRHLDDGAENVAHFVMISMLFATELRGYLFGFDNEKEGK